ncbi:hypothetical protein ACQY0O_000719 [Thecaphora frezii]
MSGNPLFLGDDPVDVSVLQPGADSDVDMDAPTSDNEMAQTNDDDANPVVDSREPEDEAEPASTSQLASSSGTISASHLPPDSELVASLPVYLSSSLVPTSSLHLFQYPIYPRDRPLPVPFSAASRGLKVTTRWRPKTNHVQVQLPLDVREEVYNMDKGAEFGAGAEMVAQKQAKIDAAFQGAAQGYASASGSGTRVKKEKMEEERRERERERGPKRLDKTRLDSHEVPNATNYMVGVIRDQALHLTPLSSVVQLRPSMHYLDALDEAREAEKRRDRAAAAGEAASDDEDEDELIEMEAGARRKSAGKKEDKKPAAQTLSVAMRGDPNAMKGGGTGSESRDNLMAAQREADAERWIDLKWRDEHEEEAKEAKSRLFAGSKKRLTCTTKPREYLIEVE